MEQLISRIWLYLKNLWRRPSDGLDTPLSKLKAPISLLSIGLNEKNKYRGDPPKAKNNAFRHLLINGRFELSSFCIDELTEENCWKLLDLNSNKDKIPARVDLTVDFVRKNTALDIEPDWNPKRHVNLSHKTEINIIAAKQKMMSQLNVTLR